MENLTPYPVSGTHPGILSIDPKTRIVQRVVSEFRTEERLVAECIEDEETADILEILGVDLR